MLTTKWKNLRFITHTRTNSHIRFFWGPAKMYGMEKEQVCACVYYHRSDDHGSIYYYKNMVGVGVVFYYCYAAVAAVLFAALCPSPDMHFNSKPTTYSLFDANLIWKTCIIFYITEHKRNRQYLFIYLMKSYLQKYYTVYV